jgi:hypothetical protein
MKTHHHHIIPRSRGGTDDPSNLIELSEYDHAYNHALDFVLFDHAPHFDFRQPGWKMLPKDLQIAVRKKMSERWAGVPKPDSQRQKMSASKVGKLNNFYGKSHDPEHLAKLRRRVWWRDESGKVETWQEECPGPGWVRGRKFAFKGGLRSA